MAKLAGRVTCPRGSSLGPARLLQHRADIRHEQRNHILSALSRGSGSPAAIQSGSVGGNANVSVGALVGIALVALVLMHFLGFRFAFDADVGRR